MSSCARLSGPCVLLAVGCLLVACSSSGDGSSEVVGHDDRYLRVASGLPERLNVLENDADAASVACVSPSNAGGRIELDPLTGEIRYTSPPGFVGTDRFHYVFETPDGEREQAEVRLRVDQLRDRAVISKGSGTIDGLGIVDRVVRSERLTVDVPTRIEPVPPSLDGKIHAHLLEVRLEEGIPYRFRFLYSIDKRPPAPLIWWEYPLALLTDSYSVPLYDDHCVDASDIITGPGWACHGSNRGAAPELLVWVTPRVTDLFNMYLWSDENDIRNPNIPGDPYITCAELPASGCGYDVVVEQLDDNAGTRANTRKFIGGSDVLGSIEWEGDEDWFKFNVYATETTTINVYPAAHPGEDTLDGYVISLYTEDGLNLDEAVPGTEGVASLTYEADSDASLRLGVFPVADTGGYRIEAVGGDVPSSTDSTAVLEVGDPIEGRLSGGQEADWYQVYLEAGTRYNARVTTGLFEVRNPALAFLDQRGELMAYSQGESEADVCGFPCTTRHGLSFLPARTGNHFLSVGAPLAGQAGLYELELTEAAGPPPGDDFAGDETTVGRGGGYFPIVGRLEQEDDQDWLAFYSFAGEQRTFYVDGIDENGDGVDGVLISVVDRQGKALSTSEPWAPGSRVVEFVAEADADYFLKIEGDSGVTTSYVVHADIGDAPSRPDTWAYVGAGGEVFGNNHSPNEGDWYRAPLAQGRTYEIRLEGIDRGFGAVAQPVLRLVRPDGEIAREADGNGGSATMTVMVDSTEPYFVGAYNLALTGGDYRLSIVELGQEACSP